MIKLLFGKAGSGKSHIGKLASLSLGMHFYDADGDLPQAFRTAIETGQKVAEEVREEYIETIIGKIKLLALANEHVCVCQALPRDKYREKILKAIPTVEYVWVDAPNHLISSRLKYRTGHIATPGYAEMVNRIFETPTVPHVRFENRDDPTNFGIQMKMAFERNTH